MLSMSQLIYDQKLMFIATIKHDEGTEAAASMV